MQEERVEIRTPKENLLVCTLVEQGGHYYAEIKSRNKSDQVDLDTMIHMLLKYNNKIKILQ